MSTLTKYTPKSVLTPAQAYVINLFLCDYPRTASFHALLDAVRTGDNRVKLWASFRNTDANGEWCDEAAEEMVLHMRAAYTDLMEGFRALPVEPPPPLFSGKLPPHKPASDAQLDALFAKWIATYDNDGQ